MRAARTTPDAGSARNVVLFIGDGMGVSTVTAARILEGQRRSESGEENRLAFEDLPHVALVKTYASDFQVPDSASTMTAITTGVKTRLGVLGLDESATRGDAASATASRVQTLLEEAEERGLVTGIVTSTSVTHATPAACYAHIPDRDWEDDSQLPAEARSAGVPDIASQLLAFAREDSATGGSDASKGFEVVLGGGRDHFLPGEHGAREDGRDLIAEWQAARPGARFVADRDELLAVEPATTGPLLGLFTPSHMTFAADRETDEPSLAEMTAAAINILSREDRANDKGFFLVVESGLIDHAHHAGNAYRALGETIELSDAVRVALERVDLEDTLVVVTADHSSVLTMAGYPSRGNDILGVVLVDTGEVEEGRKQTVPILDANELPYTTLGYANGPGARERPDLTQVDPTVPNYFQEATVPMGIATHAGEDVPAYAGGPGAGLFHGVQEQNFLYHAIRAALDWTKEP